MFDSVIASLDMDHFASGAHKTDLATLVAAPGAVFLDVRSDEERRVLDLDFGELGLTHLAIPIEQLPARLSEVPHDADVGVFCPTVVRSSIAYAFLLSQGRQRVSIIDGGNPALTAHLLPGPLRKLKRAGQAS